MHIFVLIINENEGNLPDWNFSNNSKDKRSHFKLLKVVLLCDSSPQGGLLYFAFYSSPKGSKYNNILLKMYHKLSHCSESKVFIHDSVRIFWILPRTKLTKGRQTG